MRTWIREQVNYIQSFLSKEKKISMYKFTDAMRRTERRNQQKLKQKFDISNS